MLYHGGWLSGQVLGYMHCEVFPPFLCVPCLFSSITHTLSLSQDVSHDYLKENCC